MDMQASAEAKNATTTLRQLLTVYPRLSRQGATDMLQCFANLKTLQVHHEAGLKILNTGYIFSAVSKDHVNKVYDGRWLEERTKLMGATRNEQDSMQEAGEKE